MSERVRTQGLSMLRWFTDQVRAYVGHPGQPSHVVACQAGSTSPWSRGSYPGVRASKGV